MAENVDVSCRIKDLGASRIKSFNFVIHTGLKTLCYDIDPVYTTTGIKISVYDVVMKRLQYPMDTRKHKRKVYPSEARLRGDTYYAQLDVQLRFERGNEVGFHTREFFVPVMVKSDLCLLHGLSEADLIKVKEDVNDPGGYFIVKGNERLFRNFIVTKRNHPLVMLQKKWKTMKRNYSEYGVRIRSVQNECNFANIYIHLLNDGGFEIRFVCELRSYYIQLMLLLKALVDKSDALIVKDIQKYDKDFPVMKLKNMLRDLHEKEIYSHEDAKFYLGKTFFSVLSHSQEATCFEVADHLFKKRLLVHLDKNEDKFEFLCFSLCKLHRAATHQITVDDIDNPIYQEVLTSEQTYLLLIKEGITVYLKSVSLIIQKQEKKGQFSFNKDVLKKLCNQGACLTPQVATMIATGNFPGRKSGLRSDTGYTVALKRTNVFELASQFTLICKFPVAYFLKHSRGYYPESYGFLCPTQTPEGENCGLYNYLASQCKIMDLGCHRIKEEILFNFGVIPIDDPVVFCSCRIYPVFVDGRITGWINCHLSGKLLIKLKQLKLSNNHAVPYHTEIVCILDNQNLFPGIYLFSSPCRMVRKFLNVNTQEEEYIGVFEQVFLQEELPEIAKANILGLSARMIPFCEYNNSVRNIFSSEKCKQALGLPFFNIGTRSDSKTYQLLYGQSPIISTPLYFESDFHLYPHGTNVIVAIMSYSGYDIEDALVLNKASVERGLMPAVEYKTVYYDFKELAQECDCTSKDLEFKRNAQDPHILDFLDEDGFPFIGMHVKYNDPILSVYNKQTGAFIIKRYLERHDAYIHALRLLGDTPCGTNAPKSGKKLSITFCIRRIPKEGDKFTNQHGGKGIASALMKPEDLPFTASGLVPDILFNPNSLSSRMSIGMLFEMATSKIKIQLHGNRKGKTIGYEYVVEPFEFDSKGSKNHKGKHRRKERYEEIGEALTEAGFDYFGTEKFFSGSSGLELEAEVYCGCMYYLRLHHMVEEKYQVHSVGPVDERTLQPINPGRSGAVRFGEMERDAVLSHGAAELTLDRLLLNSDKCTAFVCLRCHMIIPPVLPATVLSLGNETMTVEGRNEKEQSKSQKSRRKKELATVCKLCQVVSTFKVQIPYVLYYLVSELAVMGISMKFSDK